MKTILTLSTLAALALSVSACERPAPPPSEPAAEVAMEAPVAETPDVIPAEETAANTSSATDTPPPADDSALPANKRSHEESVQPDSETLFY